jgi:hypothetical protein
VVAELAQSIVNAGGLPVVHRELQCISEAGIAAFFGGAAEVLLLDLCRGEGTGELRVDVIDRRFDVLGAVFEVVAEHAAVCLFPVYYNSASNYQGRGMGSVQIDMSFCA